MKILLKSVELAKSHFDPASHSHRCFVLSAAWLKNRLVGVGINDSKTNPRNLINPLFCKETGKIIEKRSACAELKLFLKIKNTTNYDFGELTIVNVRLDRNFNVKNSRPCGSCYNLLKYISPRKVFYTLDTGVFEECPV